MFSRQGFELGHHVVVLAHRKQAVDALLHDYEAFSGELGTASFRVGPRYPAEGLATPECESGVQMPHHIRVIPLRLVRACEFSQALEDREVEAVRGQPEPVAGRLGHQHLTAGPAGPLWFQHSAQTCDVGVHVAVDADRRGGSPHVLDQFVARDEATAVVRQHGEHRALPGRTELDLLVTRANPQLTEQIHAEPRLRHDSLGVGSGGSLAGCPTGLATS